MHNSGFRLTFPTKLVSSPSQLDLQESSIRSSSSARGWLRGPARRNFFELESTINDMSQGELDLGSNFHLPILETTLSYYI